MALEGTMVFEHLSAFVVDDGSIHMENAYGTEVSAESDEPHIAVCEDCGAYIECAEAGCTEPAGHPYICRECLATERQRPADLMLARMEARFDD